MRYKFDVEMFDLDIADIWEHERYYFSEFDSNIKIAKITEGIIRTVLIDHTDPISKYTVHDDLSDSLKVFNKQIQKS